MPDREKVIAALGCTGDECENCPYHVVNSDELGTWGRCDEEKMHSDAIELLREQEPEYKPDGPDYFDGRTHTRWKCTSCQYFVCTEKGTPNMKFCPNCGKAVKWDA